MVAAEGDMVEPAQEIPAAAAGQLLPQDLEVRLQGEVKTATTSESLVDGPLSSGPGVGAAALAKCEHLVLRAETLQASGSSSL